MEYLRRVAPEDYLMHHGVEGQKWGRRRWQNEDGSLTPAGREHYGYKGNRYDRYENKVRSEIEGRSEATYSERKKYNSGLTKNENKRRVASQVIEDQLRKREVIDSAIGGGTVAGYIGGAIATAITGNPVFLGVSLGSIVGGSAVTAGKHFVDRKKDIRLNDIARDYKLRTHGDAKKTNSARDVM